MNNTIDTVIVGGGCFWCTEAIFQEVNGVLEVTSGYSGGNVPGKPTYREVCSGLTGHAEVVKISFDTNLISFEEILIIFMTTHDPTTLNRQGADKGTQYRSVIFYKNETEKQIATDVIHQLTTVYEDPIVTEVSQFSTFFEAEKEHQDYYRNHKEQPYCSYVISPKLNKLRQLHAQKLK